MLNNFVYCEFIMKTEIISDIVDKYQKTIDSLHKVYSRLYPYAVRRISNRYKQPGQYLLREKARELRVFVEQINRSFLLWQEAGLPQLNNPNFHKYISDVARLIRRCRSDCNLRLFGSEVLEAFQAFYDYLIQFIGEPIQLELFDSQDTFHEDESIKSKFVCQAFINFEWVPVFKCVAKFLERISEKILNYPASLVCPKSAWVSAFSFR